MPTEVPDRNAKHLMRAVVGGGFCIGCGACVAFPDSPLVMQWNDRGVYEPTLPEEHSAHSSEVSGACPFYNDLADEDTIAEELFANQCKYDRVLGFYRTIAAGSVTDESLRRNSTSGGLTTWLLCTLMDSGLIDGVIHVGRASSSRGPLFRYTKSTSVSRVREEAKSCYYPVEFSEVVAALKESPGRYAFVGVPCFVKAIRLLAKCDSTVAGRIKYCFALFCGHLKTAAFAEAMSWELGISPHELREFEFRVKLEGQPANRYGIRAIGVRNGEPCVAQALASDLACSDWGLGFFKPKACDFCDDITGETADASFGDAWMAPFVSDSRGTNIVIIRNETVEEVLREGMSRNELVCDPIVPEDVIQSQAGNYRHRREGLAYRLWLLDRRGEWHPKKREQARFDHLSQTRRRVYELRTLLSERSHDAFAEAKASNQFSVFLGRMAPMTRELHLAQGTYVRFLGKRVLRCVKQMRRDGLRIR